MTSQPAAPALPRRSPADGRPRPRLGHLGRRAARPAGGAARGVAAGRRRRPDARVRRRGAAGAHPAAAAPRCSRSATPTRAPSTSTWRCGPGTVAAPSSCCAPTRTAAPCCWSGCTPRGSRTSGTWRPARSWRVSTPPARARDAPAAHPPVVRRAGRRRSRRPPAQRPAAATAGRAGAVAGPRPRRRRRSTGTLVHGDLHYGNVLAGDREPWLAIDPRPLNGDPHYELAPMLWTRFGELTSSPAGLSLREGVRQRFLTLVDTAELDEHRARDWVVVRMLELARLRLEDPSRDPAPHLDGRPPDDVHRGGQGRPGLTRQRLPPSQNAGVSGITGVDGAPLRRPGVLGCTAQPTRPDPPDPQEACPAWPY